MYDTAHDAQTLATESHHAVQEPGHGITRKHTDKNKNWKRHLHSNMVGEDV